MQAATKLRYDNFVECFAALSWKNQAEAARQAKFAVSSARQTASRIMTYDYIVQAIAKKKAELAEKTGMTVEKMHTQYDEDRQFARKRGQAGAAVSASISTARLYGMDKDAGGKDTVTVINVVNYAGSGGSEPPKSVVSKEIADEVPE